MPSSHSASVADLLCRRLGLAPVFANHSPPPVWRHFKTFLFFGFALRILAALSNDWIFRLDELWEYLEQAHRLVFGYGVVPWEYRIGARNWSLSLPAAAVLQLCKLLGLSHPDYYVPAVKIMNTIFSMAVPVGVYFFMRRHISETAARAAFVFCCLWWEFFVLAPHTLPSFYSAALLFAALALFYPGMSGRKIMLCGFLLGMAGALRLPYIPAIGLFGLVLMLTLPPKKMPMLVLGGITALILTGFVDFLFWGEWWESYKNYIVPSLQRASDYSQTFSKWDTIIKLTNVSFGLYPAIFIFALLQWKRCWLLLIVLTAAALPHFLSSVHYSYLFLLVILFSLMFGVACDLIPRIRKATACILCITSLAAVSGFLPGLQNNFAYPARYLFYEDVHISAMKFLTRLPKDNVKAVAWFRSNPWRTGSYYYFHRTTPLYYFNYDYGVPHRKLVEESNLPFSSLFSHIVMPYTTFQSQKKAVWKDDFIAIKIFDSTLNQEHAVSLAVLKNVSGDTIHIPEKFMLDRPSLSDDFINSNMRSEIRPPIFLPMDNDIPRYPVNMECMPPLPCDAPPLKSE